jgi:hypothetical protein
LSSSVYLLLDVVELSQRLRAESAYVFVVNGLRGTDGCPVVTMAATQAEYLRRNRELLLGYMRRSVELFEQDVRRLEAAAQSGRPR